MGDGRIELNVSLFYAILESPHRWVILGGLSILAASAGAIMIMGYGWSHSVALLWFLAGLLASLFFLGRSVWDWFVRVQVALRAADGGQDDRDAGRSR